MPCALCPISLGAFKQSTDGPWVHLVSGQLLPEPVPTKIRLDEALL